MKKTLVNFLIPSIIIVSNIFNYGCGSLEKPVKRPNSSEKSSAETKQDVFVESPEPVQEQGEDIKELPQEQTDYNVPATDTTNYYPNPATENIQSSIYGYSKINSDGTINLTCGYFENPCEYDSEFLDQKLEGLTAILKDTESKTGVKSLFKPINIHFGNDSLCNRDGYYGYIGSTETNIYVCLFDNRDLVSYHELIHVLLKGRADYAGNVEEDEAYSVSKVLAGMDESICDRITSLGPLCQNYGFDVNDYVDFIQALDNEYQETGISADFQKRKDLFTESVYLSAQRTNQETSFDEVNQ